MKKNYNQGVFSYKKDIGKVRVSNDDDCKIVCNSYGNVLLLVADGMGGYKKGDYASNEVVKYLSDEFKNSYKFISVYDAYFWLEKRLRKINSELYNLSNEDKNYQGMGTTLVLAIITNDYILFGNIGDSSGFVMKDGKIHKVTKDHTLVNLLLDAGELTQEQARNHPKKNILMNALGINDPIEIDIFDCNLDVEELLLCSDGLTTMITSEQIEKVLNEEGTLEDKVIKLIKKANNRGGNDNISVAYLVKSKGSDQK